MLERLETAYQQASRFSADASHELRTPLTIMRGELESIGSIMYAEQPTQLLYERIGSVLEEAEHLSRIVEGLFAIARLEAGEARMGHEVFDLAELARSTVEQMQLLAEDKNLSITIDAANPVFVMGDAPRLKQVIVNLFDNAIKYTPDGGAIALSVSALAAKAVFAVKDNGAGIAPDALPHIFERFYRSEKARSSSAHGAGLGLSIVRSICQAHGGTVNVQSAEGKGATVTVELPLAAAHNQENAHARA
jgi:signal transduction histidine kinase